MIVAADGGSDVIADDVQFADGQVRFVELTVFHLVHDQFVDEIADFCQVNMVPFGEFCS